MPNDVHVRRYRPTDAASLVALWHEVLPSSQPWNDPQTALARKMRQQDDLIFVAEKDAEVVGAIMAGYDGVRGWIYSLAVMPDLRKCGIGRLLIREVEAALLALGCPKINLQVRSTNSEVLEFYRRCGYELEDRSSLGRLLSPELKGECPEQDCEQISALPSSKLPFAERFEIIEQPNEDQIEQLYNLIQQQWWGGKRSLDEVKLMVENTSLMLGLVDRMTGRLVGYCRVLTDFVFRATIYDVMVDREFQRGGLGEHLLNTLCKHPKLQQVNYVYLACDPQMFPFYERWGFKIYDGRAEWMVKVQHEE